MQKSDLAKGELNLYTCNLHKCYKMTKGDLAKGELNSNLYMYSVVYIEYAAPIWDPYQTTDI